MSVTIAVTVVPQHLELLPGSFVIEQPAADSTVSAAEEGWTVVTNSREGVTRVRPAREGESVDRWVAFYSGGTAHGLDVPGMTVSLLAPLSAASCALYVASTAVADLVFVPQGDQDLAVSALSEAGHIVRT